MLITRSKVSLCLTILTQKGPVAAEKASTFESLIYQGLLMYYLSSLLFIIYNYLMAHQLNQFHA